uniref:Uncharacterized protein n=1 Tax=Ixodes ricinus TaxID=34613 RepID=A0A6B0UPD9_IXORI
MKPLFFYPLFLGWEADGDDDDEVASTFRNKRILTHSLIRREIVLHLYPFLSMIFSRRSIGRYHKRHLRSRGPTSVAKLFVMRLRRVVQPALRSGSENDLYMYFHQCIGSFFGGHKNGVHVPFYT